MEEKHILGKKGEIAAENYLIQKEYQILEKNWRYLKAEIDIIVQKDNFIVFVEVKTRSTEEFGSPETFVSNKQQKLIINAAHEYITKNEIDFEARFDIISILIKDKNTEIEHIEDAFYPTM